VSQYSDLAKAWTAGVRFPAVQERDLFSSPPHWGRFWGPSSLLSNGYRCLLPGE